MLLGLVSVLIVAAVGLGAWVLLHRRAPVRAAPPAEAGEWVFANPAETAPRTPARAAARDALPVAPAEPIEEVEPLTSEQVFARLHQLCFGTAAVGEEWPPSHAEVISATADVLQSASTEDRYTPRRPSLLPQLLRAVNDEDVSRRGRL